MENEKMGNGEKNEKLKIKNEKLKMVNEKMGNGKWRMRKWKDERENTKQSGFDLGDWIFFAYFAAY